MVFFSGQQKEPWFKNGGSAASQGRGLAGARQGSVEVPLGPAAAGGAVGDVGNLSFVIQQLVTGVASRALPCSQWERRTLEAGANRRALTLLCGGVLIFGVSWKARGSKGY